MKRLAYDRHNKVDQGCDQIDLGSEDPGHSGSGLPLSPKEDIKDALAWSGSVDILSGNRFAGVLNHVHLPLLGHTARCI
jgi:hypothetical protein